MTATLRFQNVPARVGHDQALTIVRAHELGEPAAIGYAEGVHLADEFVEASRYVPYRHSDPATPMLVRPDVAVLGVREQRAYPPTWVGSWGAGPPTLAAAWPKLLLLDDGETPPFWFGNAHLAPSVTRRARTRAAREARERRRALHRLEVEGMVANAAGLDRVAYAADWNCPPSYDDVDLLRQAGFVVICHGPTHVKGGIIDWWALRGLEVVGKRRLPRYGSDHHGIEVTVR